MRPGISAVAFDLDGTLYPNYRLNIRLIPDFLKELRFLHAFSKARHILHSDMSDAKNLSGEMAGTAGQTGFYSRQAALVAGFTGAQPDYIQEKINTIIYRGWEQHFKKIELFDGVKNALETFKAAGLKLGLLSDFPPKTKIENLGITSYWDAVLCTEEIGKLKPDPLSFIKLAQVLQTDPSTILFVGNSQKFDVTGAKQAGMYAALIKRSIWSTGMTSKTKQGALICKPDFVFHDYRQLIDFVLS